MSRSFQIIGHSRAELSLSKLSSFRGPPHFYAANESSRHRKEEFRNRKMELELASIDPYLELMPDENRIALKTALSEKLFAQPSQDYDKKDNVSAASLFKLLQDTIKQLSKK